MKDYQQNMDETIAAAKVKVGDVVEINGSRIHADQVRVRKDGKVKLTTVPLNGGRVRSVLLGSKTKCRLVRR